jgi:hypothetical protein
MAMQCSPSCRVDVTHERQAGRGQSSDSLDPHAEEEAMQIHCPGRRHLGSIVAAGVMVGLAVTAASVEVSATPGLVAAAAASIPVHHVFQIVLENQNESSAFPGTGTQLDQLSHQGVFLTGYYGTGHASLDNYVAMLSGQGPYSSTTQDCPNYRDGGGSVDAQGFYHPVMPQDVGCVYPAAATTLANQLHAAHQSWRGYMQDMGNTASRETSPCGQPAAAGVAINPGVGGPDQTQAATAADQYAARHNPFVYFHSLIDPGHSGGLSLCQRHVAPLSRLAGDLASGDVASFNFITPNLCDDGHDAPCKGPGTDANPGAGGLTSANAFLAQIVPEIQASSAYKDGGLLVILFDESANDNSSCCGETGMPGIRPSGGGGRVGAVLLGPGLVPHRSSCAYNHYSLLRTLEKLFRLSPAATGLAGSDGKGHLAHAGDQGVGQFLRELTSTADPCPSG